MKRKQKKTFDEKLSKNYHILLKYSEKDLATGKKVIYYVVKEKTLVERLNEIAEMRPFEEIEQME